MFKNKGTSARRFAIGTGIIAALFTGGALAPAAAAEPLVDPATSNCILVTELEREICAPIGDDLHAKVLEETGLTVIETKTATTANRLARSTAGTQATFVIAKLYDNANQGGGVKEITSTSACNGTSVKGVADIGSSWYGRVSSFGVYAGCTVRIWENTNYSGAVYGYAGNTGYVGDAMNDRTKSLQAR